MALVHDDEIEEVRGKFLVKTGAALVLGDGLIGGKIKLAAVDHQPAFDLVPGIAEGRRRFCPWGHPPGNCGQPDIICAVFASGRPWRSTWKTRASSRFERRRRFCRCRWPWSAARASGLAKSPARRGQWRCAGNSAVLCRWSDWPA